MNTDQTPSINSTASQQVLAVLRAESQALASCLDGLSHQLDHVEAAVDLIFHCRGRVIVTGMGKMSCIARKAAATLCSTGTPAVFLHPAEAVHGDLGIVTKQDAMLLLSHSGETREVIELLPYMARIGIPTVGIVGNRNCSLGQRCRAVICTGVAEEADPVAAAPTSSTTVTLAICDALAMALMNARGFTQEQFAIFHPGGYLGSKLLIQVRDVMHTQQRIPLASPEDTLRSGITAMSEGQLGAVFVVSDAKQLIGVLTDGDLRRLIEQVAVESEGNVLDRSLSNFMNSSPRCIDEGSLAAEALRLMEDHGITVLPVVAEGNQIVGVVHLHDLVRAGLA